MSKRSYEDDDHGDRQRRPSGDFGPAPELYSIFQGEVASVQAYGVFVKIPGSKRQGLVHKSQMSRTRVDDPSEMLSKGEVVYCKVISHGEDGSKIGLSMKVVNQTTGADGDPNNVELSQDEQRRKTGHQRDIKKIELGVFLNTTCKKCGAKGHLAQDCFHVKGGKSYELVPDLEELEQLEEDGTSSKPKKKKKEKKKHKRHKSKEKKSSKDRREDSSSESSDDEPVRKKHKKHKSKDRSKRKEDSESSDSSQDIKQSKKYHKHKSEKR